MFKIMLAVEVADVDQHLQASSFSSKVKAVNPFIIKKN